VSTDGGAQPRWQRQGRELYYLSPDQVLMAAPVRSGPALTIDRAKPLFRTRLDFAATQGPYFMAGYDVSADGERFLLNAPPAQPVEPITVVLHWTSALSK